MKGGGEEKTGSFVFQKLEFRAEFAVTAISNSEPFVLRQTWASMAGGQFTWRPDEGAVRCQLFGRFSQTQLARAKNIKDKTMTGACHPDIRSLTTLGPEQARLQAQPRPSSMIR